ncbi:cysteine hydrolase family protein [Paenibacillus sepulcri]|uniref:Cysteine hydrolase n=1 Tax=Paenibacillus sepulcri TaxID=359917 RepID=A0ABS7C710_9BACL|nr:cysteine hydrolase [Paenibacillus sepulcri]
MKHYLNPQDTALVIIDMQNDFCHEEGASAKMGTGDIKAFQAAVPPINALIDQAREASVPVIFVMMTLEESTISEAWSNKFPGGSIVVKDTWGTEFYKLQPQKGDYIVEKHRFSAFIGTNLDLILRSLGRKSIVLTGVLTNVCVESTARDGFMMDYNITLVSDACAGSSPAAHQNTLDMINMVFGQTTDSASVADYWKQAMSISQ